MASVSNSGNNTLRKKHVLIQQLQHSYWYAKENGSHLHLLADLCISLQTTSPDSETCDDLSGIGKEILLLRFKLPFRCFAGFNALYFEVWASQYGRILPGSSSTQWVLNLDQFFQSYRGKPKSPSNYSTFSFPNKSQQVSITVGNLHWLLHNCLFALLMCANVRVRQRTYLKGFFG